jgi:cell division transport system permease protein
MSALAKTVSLWRAAAYGVRHAPFIQLVSVTAIAIALLAAGLVRGGVRVLEGLVTSLGTEVELTAYFDPTTREPQLRAFAERLEREVGGSARVVTPAAALSRLSEELGDLGRALKDLPDNPLPPSVELKLPPERRTPEAVRALADRVRGLPGVSGVDYGAEALERLSAVAQGARYGGIAALILVALITLVVVAATLQLAIYSRREEIEIQKLVGATDRFVRTPFLLEGMLQGVVGALVALVALGLFSALGAPALSRTFQFLEPREGFAALLDPSLVLELFVAGSVLGLLGSFVAVGRLLRA